MPYPIAKYKSNAATTFSTLFQTYQTETNNWRIGNVFDTLTDYLIRVPDAKPTPGTVIKATLDRWKQTEGCWYDDYGWWGIASAKAFDDKYANLFGLDRNEFQGIATDCWTVMHTGKPNQVHSYRGGPNVWENRDEGSSPGYFTLPATWAQPRYPGGVWQYDMFKDKRNDAECSPSNPADPTMCLLGPFQNTVMNGLYLVLALRLNLEHKGTGTGEALQSEMTFLKTWFHDPSEAERKLLWDFNDNSALVRERVSTYAFCQDLSTYPLVEGYRKEAAWGGDQGLILGGLLDYLKVEPNDQQTQLLALSIARGVFKHLVDLTGFVLPYSAHFNYEIDADDYKCGSGVFWRYLLQGFGQNALLRKEVLGLVASDPENNAVYKSAEHACSLVQSNNDLFTDFNILATLTAAIEILE